MVAMKLKFTAKANIEIAQSQSSAVLMASVFLQDGDVIM